ncbi:MAG: 2-C-methyl-D-erythritol 4-phosphate cytidylyltransferase [Candidatus Aminicenantes bacterium]|nr:2-C-methyl-D-erythritol 4-phosphate cytidylyltransferase [Candidatus Aminicenantes bacterium]
MGIKKNLTIILAGGTGCRFGEKYPKQFFRIFGKTLLEHSIHRFDIHPSIEGIIVVVHPEYEGKALEILNKNRFKKIERIMAGGRTRQESSYIGVMSVEKEYENVLIHDAVRPLVSSEMIDNLITELNTHPAVIPAILMTDTVVEVNSDSRVTGIPERQVLRMVQTPQAFRFELLKTAHKLARENRINNAVDDCSLIIRFNLADVFVIEGSDRNLKITSPVDLEIARKIWRKP